MTEQIFDLVLGALTHTCKNCAHEIHFVKPDLVLFAEETVILCDTCFTDQFTDDDFYAKFLVVWDGMVPLTLPE